jgi:predicted Zn finger-like uncharacterized protein
MLAVDDTQPHIAPAMRIHCPACQATYEVPDHLIGPGRSLRCRTCGHAWRVAPEPILSEPAASAEPAAQVEPAAPAGAKAEALPPPPEARPRPLPAPPGPLPPPPVPPEAALPADEPLAAEAPAGETEAAAETRAGRATPPLLAALRRQAKAIEPPLAQPPPAEADTALRLAWAGSLLLLLLLGLALWLFRDEIVAAWPPAARLYLMFGGTPG